MSITLESHPDHRAIVPRPGISHVIFDFDGTLSWLRHGWPELMTGLFLKHLPLGSAEETVARQQSLMRDILSLNGKHSSLQIELCATRVVEFGGPQLDASEILKQYQSQLAEMINARIVALRQGLANPNEFVLFGARDFLRALAGRKLALIILSGTAEAQVRREAELLELQPFFGAHIYGSTADIERSSKRAVIERLMAEEKIPGDRLLAFGDGPVEIQLTKEAGGMAVGVASDEENNGSGLLHPEKAPLLKSAGCDFLIPDYRNTAELMLRIFGN